MKGQNPPGQCAEPHAVSNCLQEIDINNFSRITHISVSDATFTQQCGTNVSKALKKEKDQEQARRPVGSVMPQGCIPLTTASEYQTFVEHFLSKKALRELQPDEAGARVVGKKFPRCTTCQQWINEENRVILSQISSR
ncbi:MAG: hypothetical protein K2N73_07875 [Lachnospiraceae bacterium]|nr:hypothetical protein [Lachnospiraceae bacterium]